jgi:hypothetical protein
MSRTPHGAPSVISAELKPLTPIDTAHLFSDLNAGLVQLLRKLTPEDWFRPTIAGSWRVRDVAAHLLDGTLRRLSIGRDGHRLATGPLSSFTDVVNLINELNAGGVKYAERVSPRLVTDLLEVTGQWLAEYFESLPPHGEAVFPVAWAGEERSENWMDIGREYTEHWHHQMQIRDAVRASRTDRAADDGLLQTRWFDPLMDLSVRALPRAYRDVSADAGTAVLLEVTGTKTGVWSVVRDASAWRVLRGRAENATASISTDADSAWRLLYNALSPDDARRRVKVLGNQLLAEPMFAARSVMV